MLRIALGVTLSSCVMYPSAFPISNRLAISCYGMEQDTEGCTHPDGHHTMRISKTYWSDAGAGLHVRSHWHRISEEAYLFHDESDL